ncbi:hypothetical protein MKX01_024796 [Papaver californicum]|nr:hypothetical protein MKX01_024796 [Papaver californicum]
MRRKLMSNAVASTSKTISNKSSFFKVMQIGNFEEKLRVPPAFIKYFNGKLPDKMILRSPTGRSWTIKMKKSGNKYLFFNKGWPEFVHAHSLQNTDIVVFKCQGNSKFHVKIYAKTGCEKELPSEFTEPILEVKKEEDEETDEPTYGNRYNERRKSALMTERKIGVVKTGMPRMSEHPHFVAVWRDTRKSHLTIPKDFARKFGLEKENSIVLEDPKGRSWPVDLIQVADGRINMANGWAQFSVGNKLSAGDICLFQVVNQTKGDELNVLILPKDEVEKRGWEVQISRRPDQYLDPEYKTPNLLKRSKTAYMTIPAKERVGVKEANAINSEQKSAAVKIMRGDVRVKSAFSIKSEHTHFISIWRNSRKYFMTIPRVMVRKYQLNTENSLVLQDPKGKLWPVKISLRKDGRIDIGKGWVKFSLGNRLSEGDGCLFDFLNYTKGNNTLNVRIIKKLDFEKQGVSLISTKKRIQYLGPEFKLLPGSKKACTTAPAANRAIQAADAFKSKNPTCEVIMRSSYVRKWGVGIMPAPFAKPFLTKQSQIVTLRVSDGRMWHVRCTTSSPKYQAHLLKGWYEFVLDNHLKEGDICVFELVDKNNLEMNVTIFRVNSTS